MASLMHAMSAYSNFNGRWAFGRVGCQLYGMGVGMFGLISILVKSSFYYSRPHRPAPRTRASDARPPFEIKRRQLLSF